MAHFFIVTWGQDTSGGLVIFVYSHGDGHPKQLWEQLSQRNSVVEDHVGKSHNLALCGAAG